MIYSQSQKFVFVHIPKTAGMSISAALDEFRPFWDRENLLYKVFERLVEAGVPDILTPLGARARARTDTYYHPRASEIQAEIQEEELSNWFLFSFVRNPWDREVSRYHYGRSYPGFHNHELYLSFDDFEEYVHWRAENGPSPQAIKLADESNNLLVDFVGRFEHLERDYSRIQNKLSINGEKLPKRNTTEHDHYTEYYTLETRKVMRDCYSRDIELFGYSFEDDGRRQLPAIEDFE